VRPSGSSPDPVDDPTAYQRHILSLLGEDDPADVQAATPATVRALVDEAAEDVRTRPEPREWSVLECVGHVVDAEIVSAARYRWVVAQDRPHLIGYDQDLWVDGLRHGRDDPVALLVVFEALRRANLDMWARSTAEERGRVGVHEERGPESYELIFKLIAGHDRFHLDQARRALAAVRAQSSRSSRSQSGK
jgi:DinB superfamily